MMSQISLCYHPTTVVFVDDNKNFLKTLQFEFKNKFITQFYDEPTAALQFLTTQYRACSFTQACFVPAQEAADHLYSEIDLRQIHKQAELKERFAEVAVCVLDFMMPGMSGLELSRKIKAVHPKLRVVLLTGEAEHDLAVEAFNEGIIDQFIKKSSSDLIAKLEKAIQELTVKYFMELSQAILTSMNGAAEKFKRLGDPVLVEFFKQLCRTKNISEYYLINDSGSFLLLDAKAKPYWLAVLNSKELEGFYDTAVIEEAPQAILEPLQAKLKIPFFFTEAELWTPPAAWADYLYPAQRLAGLETYYYALLEQLNTADGYPVQIMPYAHFLKNAFNPR